MGHPCSPEPWPGQASVTSSELTWDPSGSLFELPKMRWICTSSYEDTAGISMEGPVSPGKQRGTRGGVS